MISAAGRRTTMLGVGLLAGGGMSCALGQERRVAIGVLSPTGGRDGLLWRSFTERLAELGWVEGRTMATSFLSAEGDFARLPALAAELVRARVDLIVAQQSPGASAAIAATRDIPIVMVPVGDPVATGFVTNLARPGGNVTGLSNGIVELTGKRLELLHEALPSVRAVGVVGNPDDPIDAPQRTAARAAAAALGLALREHDVRSIEDFAAVFAALAADGVQAVLLLANPLATAGRERIAALAATHRLPVMGIAREDVDAGALVAYAADFVPLYRRAAEYVDRILRGAKAGDLPIEGPTRYVLVLNRAVARTLGIDIAAGVLVRADEIVD